MLDINCSLEYNENISKFVTDDRKEDNHGRTENSPPQP